jgi:hypothetical protein
MEGMAMQTLIFPSKAAIDAAYYYLRARSSTPPEYQTVKGALEAAAAALSERAPHLPEFRCDNCGNGVEIGWEFCAWCGLGAGWVPSSKRAALTTGKCE